MACSVKTHNYILIFYSFFFLSFSALQASEKSKKLKKITPLTIKRQLLPTQEDFDLVDKALDCVKQELIKENLQEQIGCDLNCGLSTPGRWQTAGGLFLEVLSDDKESDIVPSHIWTKFGAIHLVQEYDKDFFQLFSKVTMALKSRFNVRLYKKYKNLGLHTIYAITAIDLQAVPNAVELKNVERRPQKFAQKILKTWDIFYSVKQKEQLALIQKEKNEAKRREDEQKERKMLEYKKMEEETGCVVITAEDVSGVLTPYNNPIRAKGLLQLYGFRLGRWL